MPRETTDANRLRTFSKVCLSSVCILAVASFFAMGCGDVVSSDNGADASATVDAMVSPDATPPDPCKADKISGESFGECYLQALCTFFATCSGGFESVDTCVTLVGNSAFVHQTDALEAAFMSGAVALDGGEAKACFDGFSSCQLTPDSCSRMLIGQTGQNESCFNAFECGLGGRCLNVADCNMQCCTGFCEIPRQLGQSCDAQNRCEAGHYCAGPKGAETCRSGLVGDPCTVDSQCNENNRCNANGTCEARVAEGAKCGDRNDCVKPLLCSAGVCRKTDSVGDPCTNECNGGLFCNAAKKCEVKAALGEQCSTARPCANALQVSCRNKVCVKNAIAGESCTTTPCLIGLYCDADKICQPRQADGKPCAIDLECEGVCNSSKICESFDLCYE